MVVIGNGHEEPSVIDAIVRGQCRSQRGRGVPLEGYETLGLS
jgi:hypothetical protein